MQITSSINRAALRAFAALLRRWFAIFALAWLVRGGGERAGLKLAEERLSKLILVRALAELPMPSESRVRKAERKLGGKFRITGDRGATASLMRLALPKLKNATPRARRERLRRVYANLDAFVRRLIALIMRGRRLTQFIPHAPAQALCALPCVAEARLDSS